MYGKKYVEKNDSGNTSSEKALGKSLPANIDAEKSVLGAILLNDEHLTMVGEIIKPADFYLPAHQNIYQTILDISQQLKRIDIITLQDELAKKNFLEDVGGMVYLIFFCRNNYY
jgi:replicative DNA helicase